MELLLTFAVIIVAATALYLANLFRHRFDEYGERLDITEQNLASLQGSQQKLEDTAAGDRQAIMRQVKEAGKELTDQHSTDWQVLAETCERIQESLSGVTKAVSQLRGEVGEVAVALQEQGEGLGSVRQLATNHTSRMGSLDQLTADLAHSVGDMAANIAQVRTEGEQHAESLKELSADVVRARQRTADTLTSLGEQLVALAADIGLLGLDNHELWMQLRKWFGHSAQPTTAVPVRIMSGFIRAERPATIQVLPCLYESFLRKVGLDFVFREKNGRADLLYYLMSNSSGESEQLEGLVRACGDPDAAQLGLTELRSLLVAMYFGGPGTMRLGPLVFNRATEGMFRGVVLTEEEERTLNSGDLSSSSSRCLSLLKEISPERMVDLANWAASY